MSKENPRTQIEQEFIYLLLHYKECIAKFIASGVDLDIFEDNHRPLVLAIIDTYNLHDSLLTRRTYKEIVANHRVPKDRALMDMAYGRCFIRSSDKDDYNLLFERLVNDTMLRRMNDAQAEYVKNIKESCDKISCIREFIRSAEKIIEGVNPNKEKIYYDDIRNLSKSKIQYIRDVMDGKVEEEPLLLTGIPPIDNTMVTGLEKGTLTLFAADVGGFKCSREDTLIYLSDGRRKTIKELYEMQEKGEVLPQFLSLNDNNKIIKQFPLKIVSTGIKPCVEIKTSKGFNIKNTLEHRHLLLDGYKETKDIKVGDWIAISRVQFFGDQKPIKGLPTWLGCMISDGSSSQHYRFTNFDSIIIDKMKESTERLGGKLVPHGEVIGKIRDGHFRSNSTRKYGIEYGIDGKTALQKNIPEQVFSWEKESIVEFLQALYGCDGSFAIEEKKRKNGNISTRFRIQYHTSSYQLAEDLRDLLIKFGIVASIFECDSSYKNEEGVKIEKGKTYRVVIQDTLQLQKFIKEIGFLGEKQEKALQALDKISLLKSNPNKDLIPEAIWEILERKFKKYNKSLYGCRRHLKIGERGRGKEGHCGNRGKAISSDLLRRIAEYLDNDEELLLLANSDIFWDKIISIESIGDGNVYDVSMPIHHNYVANNIITHNSAIMLNIGLNVWRSGADVLFVPLEMHVDQMWRRAMSRDARLDSEYITRNLSNLTEEQYQKLLEAEKMWEKLNNKFYLLQRPGKTSVSQIRREVERHLEIFSPRLVIIDYVANLQADERRNDRNDLEIGDMLKTMRSMGKDLGFAVISAAQIGRYALSRLKKAGANRDKPIIGSEDIRGSHEYSADADNIYALLKSTTKPNKLLDLYCVKARNGKTMFGENKVRAQLCVWPEFGLIMEDESWCSSNDNTDPEFTNIRDSTVKDISLITKDEDDTIFDEGSEQDKESLKTKHKDVFDEEEEKVSVNKVDGYAHDFFDD